MLTFNIEPISKDEIKVAQGEASQAAFQSNRLREQVDKLSFVVEALWNILKNKTGANEEELKKLFAEIKSKSSDNSEFGTTLECKNCSRPVSSKSKMCVFCGAKIENENLFR